MESRFRHDFSRVRLHTDRRAAQSADAVQALAYTVGRNIVFTSGTYTPDTPSGRALLAHELTHTIQQGMYEGPLPERLSMQATDSADEAVARAQAAHVETGNLGATPANSDAPRLQRQERGAGGRPVFMCSKPLETSPLGTHAFFRIGGAGPNNPTRSLEPVNQNLFDPSDFDGQHRWGSGCYQGVLMSNYPADFHATNATCERTSMTESCLESQFAAYPVGMYCTLGPNSNTFVGVAARACGVPDPDPAGWNPGIDDTAPARDTFAPSPKFTLVAGCQDKLCGRGM